jgi:hypothetical protein
MAEYLLELRLVPLTPELLELIPDHRTHINDLFEEGVLQSYSVSASRDNIWCVIEAESPTEAQGLIELMPLYPAMESVQCTLLLFHQEGPAALPSIGLN